MELLISIKSLPICLLDASAALSERLYTLGGRTVNGIRVKSGRKVKLSRRVVAEYVEQLQAALTLVRPLKFLASPPLISREFRNLQNEL